MAAIAADANRGLLSNGSGRMQKSRNFGNFPAPRVDVRLSRALAARADLAVTVTFADVLSNDTKASL